MTLNKLNLPAMGQLGIIVENIDRSIPYYRDVMNIRPWYRTNIVEEEIYCKDRHIDIELDMAIGRIRYINLTHSPCLIVLIKYTI